MRHRFHRYVLLGTLAVAGFLLARGAGAAPLEVEEERALYPIIQAGRRATEEITKNTETDPPRRRQLLRARQEGQEAESTLLRATFGLVLLR